MYTATARASPTVLRLIHHFEDLMDHADADRKRNYFRSKQEYQRFRRSLKAQLVANVAEEVLHLKIGAAWLDVYSREGEDLLMPHVLLSQMQQLESLHLEGPLHRSILHELPSLRHLTSIKLGRTCSNGIIGAVCTTLPLLRLDIGEIGQGEEIDLQQVLPMLASGRTSVLQELALPFPAELQHLSRLTALTALTALSVKTRSAAADLGGLAGVTGLKSLRVESRGNYYDIFGGDSVEETLSPLSAMTGLTLLDLVQQDHTGTEVLVTPSHVTVLSALTSMRVLRCSFFGKAEVAAGDPLPVQLRFLRSARALEVLDLGFWASFWALPYASSLAVKEAVSGLLSLKQVTIRILIGNLEQFCLPLSAFSAASSIESLSFRADGPEFDEWEDSPVRARDCLKALTNLRSLSLAGNTVCGRVPHCAELLAGLPSTRLSSLSLSVCEADLPLPEDIARFSDLESLSLASERASWFPGFDALCDLKCLTQLEVKVISPPSPPPALLYSMYLSTRQLPRLGMNRPWSGFGKRKCHGGSSASGGDAAKLGTRICEYGRLVGVRVRVTID